MNENDLKYILSRTFKENNPKMKLQKKNEKVVSKKLIDNIKLDDKEILSINISKDLWKYALLITYIEGGEILTSKLKNKVLDYNLIGEDYKQINPKKKEPYYYQIVRNLKSNKKNKTNPIINGYFENISKGFKITQKGIDFVKREFSHYL